MNAVFDLETDAGGNVYLSGYNTNSLARITKFNSSLNVIWDLVLGSFPYGASAPAIRVDNLGNVYSMGGFSGTCDFDPGAGVTNLTVPSGKSGKFISKLNSAGQFVWVKSIIYSGSIAVMDMVTGDSGRVFISGSFKGTIDFDPGTGVTNLSSYNTTYPDAFVMCVKSSGDFEWANSYGGYDEDNGAVLDVDNLGKLYVGGKFIGSSVDFNSGPGTAILSSPTRFASYVLKLEPNGSFLSVAGILGQGSNILNTLFVDNSQNIYVGGGFSDSTDFDPGSGSNWIYGYPFERSAYLAKYSQCILPQTAGPITGPSLICTDQTYTFSVAPVSGATSYVWEIPQDATIVSGANTRTVQIKFGPNEIASAVFVRGANSCGTGILSVLNVYVKQTPYLSITTTPNDSVCPDIQVQVLASGANSYTWDNGLQNGGTFTPVQTQTYSVIGLSANGCSATKSVTITLMPRPVLSVDVQPSSIVCAGTQVTLTASGAPNMSWTGGISNGVPFIPTTSQGYIVNGFSSFGCEAYYVNTPITINPLPSVINHPVSQTVLEGSDVLLTATFQNPGALLYQWQVDGGAGFTNISNVPPYSNSTTTALSITQAPFLLNGAVFRCVATEAGCSTTTNPAVLQVTPVSVEPRVEGKSIVIYPVPAKEYIRIMGLDEGNHTVRLFTATGVGIRQFRVQKSNAEDPQVNLDFLPSGVYFLEVGNRKLRLVKNPDQ